MDNTTQTETKTYQISARGAVGFQAAVDAMTKRAKRLGLTPVAVTFGPAFDVAYVNVATSDSGGVRWVRWSADSHGPLAPLEHAGKVQYAQFHDVTVTGGVVRLAGWRFCGTLQHLEVEGGERAVLLRAVPGVELPAQFRNASPEQCDHCQRRIRTRKETFVLAHEGGRWAQVGRDCTQDFLGGADPHAVAGTIDMLLAVDQAARSASEESAFGEGGGGGGESRWPLRCFLSVTAALVRVDGWVSRGQARASEGEVESTASAAIRYLVGPPRHPLAAAAWREWATPRCPTDADAAVADGALALVRGDMADRGDLSDYEHNLSVACRLSAVGHKESGVVASLISYYLRHVSALVESSRTRPSRHVGEVGGRDLFRLTLSRVVTCESAYGTSYLHKFTCSAVGAAALADAPAGSDEVAWFSSRKDVVEDGVPMVEGRTYVVRATVKAHGEYRGTQQTSLTRVSVLTDGQVAAESAKLARAAKRGAKRAQTSAQA